jgi:hypothetical protein
VKPTKKVAETQHPAAHAPPGRRREAPMRLPVDGLHRDRGPTFSQAEGNRSADGGRYGNTDKRYVIRRSSPTARGSGAGLTIFAERKLQA